VLVEWERTNQSTRGKSGEGETTEKKGWGPTFWTREEGLDQMAQWFKNSGRKGEPKFREEIERGGQLRREGRCRSAPEVAGKLGAAHGRGKEGENIHDQNRMGLVFCEN